MKINLRKNNSSGFAIIEIVLIIAVTAVIVGLAVTYLNQQKQPATANNINANNSVNKTTDSTKDLQKTTTTPTTGTTSSITELITKAAESEAGIDSAADSQIQTNATSADSTATNIGGAYDASNL